MGRPLRELENEKEMQGRRIWEAWGWTTPRSAQEARPDSVGFTEDETTGEDNVVIDWL